MKISNYKLVGIVVFVCLCWMVLIFFGKGNPSKGESEESLRFMSKDMDFALQSGGEIESRDSSAKYGGALLFVNVNAESWSLDLADKYRISLLRRGWAQKDSTKNKIYLCKNGMRATIILFPEFDSSRGSRKKVYGFSMAYNGGTISECKE